jgi:hypothetical protein
MTKNAIAVFLLMALIIIGYSCKNDNKNADNKQVTDLDEEFKTSGGLIKLNDRLFSIPAPMQISKMVKEAGIAYNRNYLNPTESLSKYSSTFKQALNLGVYGADLGYLNTYDQLPDAAMYFGVVKVLSKELGILASINQDMISRFEANKENRDSVMSIVSSMYRDADSYLMNNERNEIGIIILAGGWIESLHFLTKIASESKSDLIINRIAEQKYPLDNLIELMRPYYGKQSDEFDELLAALVDLATIFDGITVSYTYEEPVTYAEKKLTVINSTTKAIIQDVHLDMITKQLQLIRDLTIK